MNNEELYNKIIKCTLEGIHYKGDIFHNSYLLVRDINNLTSGLDVDLKGDLDFNTEFNVKNIEEVIEINSLKELYKFCEERSIAIDKRYVHEKGLIVGGSKDFLILNDLSVYGELSEDYISMNDYERKKLIDEIEIKNNEEENEEEII